MDSYTSPYANHLNNAGRNHGYDYRVKEFIVMTTRPYGYNDMIVRGFTSNVSDDVKNRILNDVERIGSVSAVSESTANLVKIGARPIAMANITGGWRERRFTFQAVIECMPTGENIAQQPYDLILSGYSDPSSSFQVINYGGNSSPDTELRFFINNVQKVSRNRQGTAVTNMEHLGISSPVNFHQGTDFLMRPEDIMSDINSTTISRMYNGGVIGIGRTASNDPATFNKLHMSGRAYANDIINSVVQGTETSYSSRMALQNMFANGLSQNFSEASHFLHNDTVDTDMFFITLQECSSFPIEDGYVFNLNTLLRIDRNFNLNTIKFLDLDFNPRFEMDRLVTTADTEGLAGTNVLVSKVTELHNNLVALFTQHFISYIKLRIYNYIDHDSGMPLLRCAWEIPKDGLGNLELGFNYNAIASSAAIINRLHKAITMAINYNIDPMLSDGGYTKYEVYISARAASDTTILISLDDQPVVPFRFATFADTSFTPMVADKETKDSMTANMSSLATEVATIVTSANGHQINY